MGLLFAVAAVFAAAPSARKVLTAASGGFSRTDLLSGSYSFAGGVRQGTFVSFEAGKAVYAEGLEFGLQDYYPVFSEAIIGTFKIDGEKIDFKGLTVVFSAEITVTLAGADGWNGAGLLLGNDGTDYYFFRMQNDGGAHIICWNSGTGAETLISSKYGLTGNFIPTAGNTLSFEMLRTPESVTVVSNGVPLFDEVPVPALGSAVGLVFAMVGGGSYAENIEFYALDENLTVEIRVEPAYPAINQNYPQNTAPIVPVTADPDRNGNRALIVIGSICAGLGLAGTVVCAVTLFNKKVLRK
jgi:hypothetical protein